MKQNPLKRVIAWLDLHLEETILIITGSLIGIVIMMKSKRESSAESLHLVSD